jgi:hypothetical protein
LPFQFALGAQTSNLISESLVGLITPATRQKAGNSLYGVAEPPAGGANAPAATDCAVVIVVLGSFNADSSSHVAAETEPDASAVSGRTINHCQQNLSRDVLFIEILVLNVVALLFINKSPQ